MHTLIRKSFLGCIFLGFVLVLLGWALTPDINLLGVAGTGFILAVYGLIGFFVFPKIQPEILKWAGILGLAAGAVFAGEIILEYVVLPANNANWGNIEFGSVFGVYFLSGLFTAYRQNSLRKGIVAAIATAMLSSAIWLIAALSMFYLFRGTYRQERVFLAEGNYADFSSSGMSNFNTFIMEDFLGAGFFHLFLGPMIAAVLGAIGGVAGKILARIKPSH